MLNPIPNSLPTCSFPRLEIVALEDPLPQLCQFPVQRKAVQCQRVALAEHHRGVWTGKGDQRTQNDVGTRRVRFGASSRKGTTVIRWNINNCFDQTSTNQRWHTTFEVPLPVWGGYRISQGRHCMTSCCNYCTVRDPPSPFRAAFFLRRSGR